VPSELIASEFGPKVAALVEEVTDDKSLDKAERKRLQIERASKKSASAKIIKLADKTSNLRAIAFSPSPDWSVKRRLEYIDWAKKVVQSLRGACPWLEGQFDRAVEDAERSLAVPKARASGMPSPSLVLHIPHSSPLVPPRRERNLLRDDWTLALELLRMTDAFTDNLFGPTPFEAARIVFPVSRLVCDVERFPDDADEMALRGMGAVYVKTTDGRPLREQLTPTERARLIETWYRPHHQRLTQGDCRWEGLHHRRLPQLLVATSASRT
jgi:hypothetical protein